MSEDKFLKDALDKMTKQTKEDEAINLFADDCSNNDAAYRKLVKELGDVDE